MNNTSPHKVAAWQGFKQSSEGNAEHLKRSVAHIRNQVKNDLKILRSANFTVGDAAKVGK